MVNDIGIYPHDCAAFLCLLNLIDTPLQFYKYFQDCFFGSRTWKKFGCMMFLKNQHLQKEIEGSKVGQRRKSNFPAGPQRPQLTLLELCNNGVGVF